jgi:hypothetical protein
MLYVVGFALGDGATEETLTKMWSYFTDTYPMGAIYLPDDCVNKEKKTITMIGPSLAQIVSYVEDSCDNSKVVILGIKAGKLTKEAAEKLIKKMKLMKNDKSRLRVD